MAYTTSQFRIKLIGYRLLNKAEFGFSFWTPKILDLTAPKENNIKKILQKLVFYSAVKITKGKT